MQKPKFRVWDTVENKWYPESNIAIDNLGNTFVFGPNTDECDLEGRDVYVVSLVDDADKQVIELFTGLEDKNHKGIYKGDIVSNGKMAAQVVWRICSWGIENDPEHGGSIDMLSFNGKQRGFQGSLFNTEVIGNIHENPDLLNK